MTAAGGAALVDRMRAAALALVATLEPSQHDALASSLADEAFREWSYLPGPRPGLPLADLGSPQRQAALHLLDTGCSVGGARTARDVIELDHLRRELGGGAPAPGDDRFLFRVFGDPRRDPAWAWRVNGHHLAVQVTVVGDAVSVTPSFFGAEPATVPSGPRGGLRVLSVEEELGRELLTSLDAGQRSVAVTSDTAPPDVLTRSDPVADTSLVAAGIGHDDLHPGQQQLLERLVRHYFDRTPEALAERAWADVVDAGLEAVRFAWAGGARPGEGHYYSVLGPTFLLEYDNTQDGANHVHSVWRDLRHDWGSDLLARHYAAAHHR
jgi:hypothetical protein